MGLSRRHYLPGVAIVLATVLTLAFFLVNSYRETVRLVKERFFVQQALVTRQTALGIEKNFALLERESELLADRAALRKFDLDRSRDALQLTFDFVKRFSVNDISLSDRGGIVRLTINSPELVGRDFSFRQYFRRLSESAGAAPTYEHITFQGFRKGRKGIIIARAVRGRAGEFRGPLVFVVEVGDLIGELIGQLPAGTSGWVVDGDGIILYHPTLAAGSRIDDGGIPDPDFARFVAALRRGATERGEYRAKPGESSRTMATAMTIQVAGQPLSVVIETSENLVHGYLREFQLGTILGVALSAIALFGSLFLGLLLLRRTSRDLDREAITRRQAEERHRESEEHFRLLIEYSPIAMAIVDSDDRFIFVNRRFTETLGYDLAAVPDVEHWLAAAYPDQTYRREMRERWQRFRERPASRPGSQRPSEYQVADAGGTPHTMELHGAHIGDRYLTVFNDITERLRLEHQLQHSQKMDCFGRLAAGVAHDFNNILSVIMGYAELLQSKLEQDDPRRASLNVILGAVNSAAKLTSSLLAFSRKQVLNPQPLDLGELVTGVQRLISRLIGEDIAIETALAPGKNTVLADYGQLEQVLVNLATNARDAMPRGGTIRIATGTATLDAQAAARVGAARPGTCATLAFSDTGAGMDQRTLEQIFEPFFTTKDLGRGTGLGLAIVYGIVKQHSGGIDVASQPGAGTTFTIYLPLYMQDLAVVPAQDLATNAPEALGHGETILLAEDDAMVREAIVQTLTSSGYRVQVAADGEEVARIYRALGGNVDLLLLDVIMPKKSGKEAYDEIRARWGNVNVLFLSGYAPDLVLRKLLSDAAVPFLQKPVSRQVLLDKVRELLESDPRRPA
ncbi:MAG: hybrid sensor histidine kinase/response regulator [Candidatus Methylomirabilia bacterium]